MLKLKPVSDLESGIERGRVRCGCLNVIGNANSRRLEFQYRPHNFTTLDQREAGEITTLVDEKIEDEEMHA